MDQVEMHFADAESTGVEWASFVAVRQSSRKIGKRIAYLIAVGMITRPDRVEIWPL